MPALLDALTRRLIAICEPVAAKLFSRRRHDSFGKDDALVVLLHARGIK